MRHHRSIRTRGRRFLAGRISSVLSLVFSVVMSEAAGPNYFTRVWQTDDGLPQNGVSAVVQSYEGYLWIGTYSGLARFDGTRFVVFNNNNTPQMYSSRVTALFEDSAGNLWIGYETGGITWYRDGLFQTLEVNPAWAGRRILGFGETGGGDIWALGVDGSLFRPRDGRILVRETRVVSELGSLVRDGTGRTWVVWNGGVSQLDRDQLIPAPFGSEVPNGFVQGLCASRDGGLWVAIDGRVRKWVDDKWSDEEKPAPWGFSLSTSAFLERRGGGLAVGVVDRGVDLISPDGGVLYFNLTNGLPSDWVRALCEDREGNLWMGTGNGLVALRTSKVTKVNPPDQWQGRAVLSISTARDGSLWIGTEGAGLYHLNQGAWTQSGAMEGLLNTFVWTVSEDPRGKLWVGTWGGGLFVGDGSQFRRAPGLEEVTIPMLALLHADDGTTWVGTEAGLIHCVEGKAKWYGRNKGLIYPDVRAVVQDREGTVWFGMLGGGLGLLKNDSVQQYRKANGLSSDFVQCLRLDTNGVLWIGTFGGGLNRLKQGRFSAIGTAQGLPNDVICAMQEDGRGNLWFSSHGGVFRISKEELNQCADGLTNSVYALTFGKGDGLPTLECSGGLQPAACETPDGRLWFPTSKGLVAIDPNERNINHLPPPIIIEEVLVDGQPAARPLARLTPLNIPPGHTRFEFRFTGLSLTAPEKVKFRYRVNGLEAEWVDGGAKRSANYSHIPPGNYRFQVIGCNNDGIWSQTGDALTFTVLPYFWQTLWFKSVAGVLVALAIGGAVWFETRRRMRWKLERLERQRAVERERARIAKDIHDDLGASLTRITLLSQSARSDLDDPARAAADLDRIYNTARALTRSMDEIVWAVNPEHDTLDSLASYLGKFAQDFLGAAGVSCRLDLSVLLPAWPLTAEMRHNLFLAFKEALHNTVKHAGATEVRVSLALEAALFTLSVEDNGSGFATAAPGSEHPPEGTAPVRRNGLANMRRRLGEIGGRTEIQSSPGRGTKVSFIVPVPMQQPDSAHPESAAARIPAFAAGLGSSAQHR